jgi:hypothetical protein
MIRLGDSKSVKNLFENYVVIMDTLIPKSILVNLVSEVLSSHSRQRVSHVAVENTRLTLEKHIEGHQQDQMRRERRVASLRLRSCI